ncbi:hypothetical protein D3C86_1604940 [compost metagenome]
MLELAVKTAGELTFTVMLGGVIIGISRLPTLIVAVAAAEVIPQVLSNAFTV